MNCNRNGDRFAAHRQKPFAMSKFGTPFYRELENANKDLFRSSRMCKTGNTEIIKVTVPAHLSHTGKDRLARKPIDACIAQIVKALNKAGIETISSCCGHGQRIGEILLRDGRVLSVSPSEKVRAMLPCCLVAAVFLAACSTTIYEDGKKVAVMQGDATNVNFKTARTEFHADALNNSTASIAAGQAASQVIGAVSGLAGTIGTAVVAGIVSTHAPVAAVTAPAVATTASHATNSATSTRTNKELTKRKELEKR